MKIPIFINEKKIGTIADCWENLSAKEYISVVNLLYKNSSDQEIEAKLEAIFILAKFKWLRIYRTFNFNIFKDNTNYKAFFIEQFFSELFPIISFVFEAKPFSKNLIPTIRSGIFSKLYGPDDKLLNLTAEEFEKCEYFNAHWHASNDIEFLYYLVSILYRKGVNRNTAKINGDKRIPFNINLLEDYYNNVKLIKIETVKAIHHWYESCIRTIYSENKDAFPTNNTTAIELDAESWRKILRALSNSKLGAKKDILKTPISEIFFELKQLEIERKLLEKNK